MPGLWLHNLPNDVLHVIATILRPEPFPTYPKESQMALGEDTNIIWTSRWKSQRSEVLSFAMTCQEIYRIMISTLWSSLVVPREADLQEILKVLQKNPTLTRFIHGLYLTETMTGSDPQQLDQNEQVKPETLTKALSLMPNIRDMLISFTSSSSHIGFLVPALVHAAQGNQRNQGSETLLISSPTSIELATAAFNFNSIRSLRLRQDLSRPRQPGNWLMDTLYIDITPLLSRLPAIETLETCGDRWDMWVPRGKYRQPKFVDMLVTPELQGWHLKYPYCQNLRHIRLYNTEILEQHLVGIISGCPSLTSLLVYFEGFCNRKDFDELPLGISLNMALEKVSATLKTLQILSPPSSSYLTPNLGRDKTDVCERRLTCLPYLVNLKILEVDLRGLFGAIPFLTQEDVGRIQFPISLKELTIDCRIARPREKYEWENFETDIQDLEMLLECLKAVPWSKYLRLWKVNIAASFSLSRTKELYQESRVVLKRIVSYLHHLGFKAEIVRAAETFHSEWEGEPATDSDDERTAARYKEGRKLRIMRKIRRSKDEEATAEMERTFEHFGFFDH